jgi:hypothetical protein
MPKVTYIEYDGTEHPVEVPPGLSVMRGAVNNNVPASMPIAAASAPAPPVTFMSIRRGSTRPAPRCRARRRRAC